MSEHPTTEHSAEVLEKAFAFVLRDPKLVTCYAPEQSSSGLWTTTVLADKKGPISVGRGPTRVDSAVAAWEESTRKQPELDFTESDEGNDTAPESDDWLENAECEHPEYKGLGCWPEVDANDEPVQPDGFESGNPDTCNGSAEDCRRHMNLSNFGASPPETVPDEEEPGNEEQDGAGVETEGDDEKEQETAPE